MDFSMFLAIFWRFLEIQVCFWPPHLKLNVIMDLKNIPKASKHAFECLVWRETLLNHLVYHRLVENTNFLKFSFLKFLTFSYVGNFDVFSWFWEVFEKPMGKLFFAPLQNMFCNCFLAHPSKIDPVYPTVPPKAFKSAENLQIYQKYAYNWFLVKPGWFIWFFGLTTHLKVLFNAFEKIFKTCFAIIFWHIPPNRPSIPNSIPKNLQKCWKPTDLPKICI